MPRRRHEQREHVCLFSRPEPPRWSSRWATGGSPPRLSVYVSRGLAEAHLWVLACTSVCGKRVHARVPSLITNAGSSTTPQLLVGKAMGAPRQVHLGRGCRHPGLGSSRRALCQAPSPVFPKSCVSSGRRRPRARDSLTHASSACFVRTLGFRQHLGVFLHVQLLRKGVVMGKTMRYKTQKFTGAVGRQSVPVPEGA